MYSTGANWSVTLPKESGLIFHMIIIMSNDFKSTLTQNILSVNEKLPVSKFRYFGKYIIQLFGYCYVYVSGQRQSGLER